MTLEQVSFLRDVCVDSGLDYEVRDEYCGHRLRCGATTYAIVVCDVLTLLSAMWAYDGEKRGLAPDTLRQDSMGRDVIIY